MLGRQVTLEELEQYLDSLKPERVIDRIIVHHFWRPRAAEWKGFRTLLGVCNYHVSKGWSDIGYHLVIGPDETIWLARPMEQVGAHAIGQNERSIGMAYAADFDTEEPAKNGYEVGVMACAAIARRFGRCVDDIFFHCDFADKTCPGTRMDRKRFRHDAAVVLNKQTEDGYVRLKIDDKIILGARIVIVNGSAVGFQGPIDAALGLECSAPNRRVPIREYLKTRGVLIPPGGWHREHGPHGTIYAYTQNR